MNHITLSKEEEEIILMNASKVTFIVYIKSRFNNQVTDFCFIELSTMLPEHLLESVPASSNVMSVATGQNGANGKPINKGTILKLSVDHIKELREEVTNCKGKIKELEHLIELAKRGESHLKQEENLDLYAQQQQQQQQHAMHNMMNQHNVRPRHERVGSIQFQQQFGKLHITGDEQQQQA